MITRDQALDLGYREHDTVSDINPITGERNRP